MEGTAAALLENKNKNYEEKEYELSGFPFQLGNHLTLPSQG
jgi:hypothetical protein